jgi:hypothetical protein
MLGIKVLLKKNETIILYKFQRSPSTSAQPGKLYRSYSKNGCKGETREENDLLRSENSKGDILGLHR